MVLRVITRAGKREGINVMVLDDVMYHLPLPCGMGSRKLTLRLAIDAHEGLSIFSEAKGRFSEAKGTHGKQYLRYEGVICINCNGHRYLCYMLHC